eukprot:scaffold181706_cov19-Tisochrysis_lutea.AAC.1
MELANSVMQEMHLRCLYFVRLGGPACYRQVVLGQAERTLIHAPIQGLGHRVLRFQNAEQFIATQGAPVTPRKLLGSTSVASWLTNIGGLAGPGKKVALVCTRNAADMEMIYRIFRAWVGEAIKEWHLFEGAKDWSKTLCVTVWLELEGPFTGATYPVLHLLALMNMLFWLLADSERA